jgi:superfamily II DNA helicase RecQ
MALTATSTKKVNIMEHLQLMEDNTDVIFKSPDRPNIFLEIVKKESTEYETCDTSIFGILMCTFMIHFK